MTGTTREILILLALYFASVILIGFWSGRRAKTPPAYLIASHRANFWRVSASLFTLLGGGELVTMASLSYTYSFAAMWFFGGVAAGFITLGIVVPRIRSEDDFAHYTGLPDFFNRRFSPSAGVAAAFVVILAFFSLLMIQFIVGGKLLAHFLGWPYPVVVLCMSAVIVIYLSMGGYEAVLSTDVLQAVVMVIFGAIILLGLPRGVTQAATPAASMPAVESLIFFLTAWLAVVASADIWQIIFASRSATVARGGLFMAAFGFTVFGLFLSHLGNVTRTFQPHLASPDDAFQAAIAQVLPESLLPVAIIFVFAAVMSTADTEIFVVTRTVVREIRRRTSTTLEDDTERRFTIAGTSYVALLGALSAIVVTENLQLIYFTLIGLALALSPAMILYWWVPVPGVAATLSVLAAPVALLCAWATGFLSPATAPIVALVGSVLGLLLGFLLPRRAHLRNA